MRLAVKYSMDDVQKAIVRVIHSLPFESKIAPLAFISEFLPEFPNGFFKKVFVQACSTGDHPPPGDDLEPLMAFPNVVSLMMTYREGVIQPNRALWDLNESGASDWLDRQIASLDLCPRKCP